MKFLLTVIKIYIWLIIAWALMSWFPGLNNSIVRQIIGIPIVPVLKIFNFASFGAGGIGFQPMIVIFILMIIERWIERKYHEHNHLGYAGNTVKDRHGFEGKTEGYTEYDRPWYENFDTENEKEQKIYGKAAPRSDISTPYRPIVDTVESEPMLDYPDISDTHVENAEFTEVDTTENSQ